MHDALKRGCKLRPLITAVGVEPEKKGIETEQTRHDENATVAILNIGGVNDGVQALSHLGIARRMACSHPSRLTGLL